jgi:hypothetical protein
MSDNDDDYEVGYGKPPKHTRFKKGQSGNPKGRPKGSKNFGTDLWEELNERIEIRENGKLKRVTKQRAIVKTNVAQAAQGNHRAYQNLLRSFAQYLLNTEGTDGQKPLAAEDAEIIKLVMTKLMGSADDEN